MQYLVSNTEVRAHGILQDSIESLDQLRALPHPTNLSVVVKNSPNGDNARGIVFTFSVAFGPRTGRRSEACSDHTLEQQRKLADIDACKKVLNREVALI